MQPSILGNEAADELAKNTAEGKTHMGILGNEAADELAKNTAEGLPPDDHKKWMSGGGIRHWARERKRESVEDGEEGVIDRVLE